MNDYVQGIIDSLVTWYKEHLDAAMDRLHVLEREIFVERRRTDRLQHHVHRLRSENIVLEQHLEALRQVLDGFVEQANENVRRDLLDAFNAVAAEGGPDINDLLADEVLSESSEDIMDMMF